MSTLPCRSELAKRGLALGELLNASSAQVLAEVGRLVRCHVATLQPLTSQIMDANKAIVLATASDKDSITLYAERGADST
jgi:hypothetical protein